MEICVLKAMRPVSWANKNHLGITRLLEVFSGMGEVKFSYIP